MKKTNKQTNQTKIINKKEDTMNKKNTECIHSESNTTLQDLQRLRDRKEDNIEDTKQALRSQNNAIACYKDHINKAEDIKTKLYNDLDSNVKEHGCLCGQIKSILKTY